MDFEQTTEEAMLVQRMFELTICLLFLMLWVQLYFDKKVIELLFNEFRVLLNLVLAFRYYRNATL